jgi:polyhydroxyalkanoate synthase
LPPHEWFARAGQSEGSWWPEWIAWLAGLSGAPVDPPPMGGPGAEPTRLADAPGSYVLMR